MWSRRLSKVTGMDEKNFVEALAKAFDSEAIANKISTIIAVEVAAIIQESDSGIKAVIESENREMKALIHSQTAEIKKRDEEIKSLKTKVEMLENANDDLEQYTRRNSVRISGFPDPEPNHEDPTQVVLTLFNQTMAMGQSESPILLSDIDRVHRVGPKSSSSPRPMLVKFATYNARQRVYKAKKHLRVNASFRGMNETTSQTASGTEGTNKSPEQVSASPRIFINEDLTKTRVGLLFRARQAKKARRINDCWTHDGLILVKDKVNKVIPIRNMLELQKVIE